MRKHELPYLNGTEIKALQRTCFFDYDKIPENLRLGRSPHEKVRLYKGAQRGLESVGFYSHALEIGEKSKIEQVKSIVYSGNMSKIEALFDSHTSANSLSALLSTTFNPQMAQVFAPHRLNREYTIYEITVDASKCLYDVFDTGHCGKSGEIFVIGMISPAEITAIKKDNGDEESELFFRDRDGTGLIAHKPDHHSTNRSVRNPKNWKRPLNLRSIFG